MKIIIEKEVKTIYEAHEFLGALLHQKAVAVRKKIDQKEAAKIMSPPVRNYDANREILKYVREAGRKGRTTEEMARDLANLGAGKNRFYFAQKAYDLLSKRRLARFTGEHGQYVYIMPYFRKGATAPKPAPKPRKEKQFSLFVPRTKPVQKFSQTGNSGSREVMAAAQLILEDRKEKGALFGEIRDLVSPSLKQYSPNYTSAMVSFLKKKGAIIGREEHVPNTSNRFRYYLPEYAPRA